MAGGWLVLCGEATAVNKEAVIQEISKCLSKSYIGS
jgi:hypothetical protein